MKLSGKNRLGRRFASVGFAGGPADQVVGTDDLVLLCSFGPNLAAERTYRELRDALLAAGFPGSAVWHLIRVSPLLRRGTDGRYSLRQPLTNGQAFDG